MKDSLLQSNIHTPKKSNFKLHSQVFNHKKQNANQKNESNSQFYDLENEIKSVLENKTDISLSDSSISSSEEANNEVLNYLTDSKFWQYQSDELKVNDSPKSSKWTKEDKDSGYKTEQTKSSNKQSTQSNEEDNNSNCEKNINENENINKERIIKDNNSNKYNIQNLKMMNNINMDSNYNIMGNNFINNGMKYYQGSFPFQQIYTFMPSYNCLYNKLQEQQNLYQHMNNMNLNNKMGNNTTYPKVNLNMMFNPNLQQSIKNTKIFQNDNNNIENNNIKCDNKSNSNDKSAKNNSNSVNKNIIVKNEQKNKNNNKTKKNNTPTKVTNLQNNKGNLKGEKQVLNLDDIVSGKDTRTTIMIRNIPIKYTDEILSEDLNEFKGKYDCLYLPFDYDKNGNKGYAFINFINPLHILYFYEKYNGKKWSYFESSKICELNSAHFQGINEIQKHAKSYKQKEPNFYSKNDENIIIPSKYLAKLLKRFPKMKYNENKNKKIFTVKSFE